MAKVKLTAVVRVEYEADLEDEGFSSAQAVREYHEKLFNRNPFDIPNLSKARVRVTVRR